MKVTKYIYSSDALKAAITDILIIKMSELTAFESLVENHQLNLQFQELYRDVQLVV